MRSSSSAASRIAFFISLFCVATNVHGCLCAPDGAVDAVRTASSMSSCGTGSELNILMLLRVFISEKKDSALCCMSCSGIR